VGLGSSRFASLLRRRGRRNCSLIVGSVTHCPALRPTRVVPPVRSRQGRRPPDHREGRGMIAGGKDGLRPSFLWVAGGGGAAPLLSCGPLPHVTGVPEFHLSELRHAKNVPGEKEGRSPSFGPDPPVRLPPAPFPKTEGWGLPCAQGGGWAMGHNSDYERAVAAPPAPQQRRESGGVVTHAPPPPGPPKRDEGARPTRPSPFERTTKHRTPSCQTPDRCSPHVRGAG
jgi:hypothetical protein